MIRRLSALLLGTLASTLVSAQDFERLAPKLPPRPGQTAPDEPPPARTATPARPSLPPRPATAGLPNLRGLRFVSETRQVRAKGVSGSGVQVEGIEMLAGPKFTERMQRYLGQAVTFELVNLIAQDVAAYYAEKDRPVVNVTAPEQDVTSGVVQFVVVEGKVGEVRVEGNRWFRTALFRNSVRLREAEPILKSRLDADIARLNNNSFRSVNSVFTPGTAPGTTDVVLRVQDRLPLRVYTGYENTGIELTDENRVFAGFNWGNAFWLDHQLNYQFTASPDFELFRAHSGSYFIPLPWRHTLTFFGSYAETEPELPSDFSQKGESYQISGRYGIPLPTVRSFRHELVLGYDFKSTNNNLVFGGVEIFDSSLDVSQFVLSYNGGFDYKLGRIGFEASLFASPGNMTDDNNEEAFAQTREGADPEYVYTLLRLNHLAPLPWGLSLSNQFTGQIASGPLVGTEQLGFGGYNSIRGYSERVVNGDGGFIMNHELRAPALSPLRALGVTKVQDSLQFLAFWDFGIATIKDAAPGEDDSITLSSVGVGLRYALNPYVSVRADYGWQLAEVEGDDEDARFHVGVTVSY